MVRKVRESITRTVRRALRTREGRARNGAGGEEPLLSGTEQGAAPSVQRQFRRRPRASAGWFLGLSTADIWGQTVLLWELSCALQAVEYPPFRL